MADRYECDECGACCKALYIEIDELDLIREPRLIQVSKPIRKPPGMVFVDSNDNEVEETIPGFGAGAILASATARPCAMCGPDNLCVIYPTRPNCCVAFRAGSEQCQDARESMGIDPLKPIGVTEQ